MSSTRNDPECDFQGLIPRYLPPSAFGGEDDTNMIAVSAASSPAKVVLTQPVEISLADEGTLATAEATQAGLRAARAALAAIQARATY
jgi:hypothetical protein